MLDLAPEKSKALSAMDESLHRDDLRELQRRLRDEFRSEREEVELLAAKDALRQRELVDVAAELMNRGDEVEIGVVQRLFRGRVLHAGKDFITLGSSASTVDITLFGPLYLKVVKRARSGGVSRTPGSTLFRNRLLEYETADARLEVGSSALPGGFRAKVVAVGIDHVALRGTDDTEWFLPIASIAFVAAPRE